MLFTSRQLKWLQKRSAFHQFWEKHILLPTCSAHSLFYCKYVLSLCNFATLMSIFIMCSCQWSIVLGATHAGLKLVTSTTLMQTQCTVCLRLNILFIHTVFQYFFFFFKKTLHNIQNNLTTLLCWCAFFTCMNSRIPWMHKITSSMAPVFRSIRILLKTSKHTNVGWERLKLTLNLQEKRNSSLS